LRNKCQHATRGIGINTDNFKSTTKRKREIGGITPPYCDTPRHLPWLYVVYRTEIYPCFDGRSRYSSHPTFIHARPNDPGAVNAEPHTSPYRIDHRKPPYARRVQLKMNRNTGPPASQSHGNWLLRPFVRGHRLQRCSRAGHGSIVLHEETLPYTGQAAKEWSTRPTGTSTLTSPPASRPRWASGISVERVGPDHSR